LVTPSGELLEVRNGRFGKRLLIPVEDVLEILPKQRRIIVRARTRALGTKRRGSLGFHILVRIRSLVGRLQLYGMPRKRTRIVAV
jgi:hypothetical protein